MADRCRGGRTFGKRSWTSTALLIDADGNTTHLIGTPEQVEALCDYPELDVTMFLVRGFDRLAHNMAYGWDLIPMTGRSADCRGAGGEGGVTIPGQASHDR